MLQDHRILMDGVCHSQPQEWSSLVSAVQYLYFISAQNPLGISARDMTMGYAIAQNTHKSLMPFKVPKGMPETDVCIRLFDNFRNPYSLFMRVTQEERLRDQARINSKRWMRTLQPGDVVYRKLPQAARGPKMLFSPLTKGPYIVKGQRTFQSVILEDVHGNLVSNGDNIPLSEILPGEKPKAVQIEDDSDVRPLSAMLAQEQKHPKKAGQKAGWYGLRYNAMVAYQTAHQGAEAKLLTVGKVLANYTEDEEIAVQPYRGCWENLIVVHRPQYQTRDGLTDDANAQPAKARIKYEMIKFQVQLLQSGNLNYDSVARLRKGRYGLRMTEMETIRFLHMAASMPEPMPEPSQESAPPMPQGNLCEICQGWGRFPHARCDFCGASPCYHHGRCCPDNRGHGRCEYCNGRGNFPHPQCDFCDARPCFHHGRCCPGNPANTYCDICQGPGNFPETNCGSCGASPSWHHEHCCYSQRHGSKPPTGETIGNDSEYQGNTAAFRASAPSSSSSSSQQPQTFSNRLRQYDDSIVMLDDEAIATRSWLNTGEDLISQIQRSGQPVPSSHKFEGGESLLSLSSDYWNTEIPKPPRDIRIKFFDKDSKVLHTGVVRKAFRHRTLPRDKQHLWPDVHRRVTEDATTGEVIDDRQKEYEQVCFTCEPESEPTLEGSWIRSGPKWDQFYAIGEGDSKAFRVRCTASCCEGEDQERGSSGPSLVPDQCCQCHDDIVKGTVIDDAVTTCTYCQKDMHVACRTSRYDFCAKAKEVTEMCQDVQANEFQLLRCMLLHADAKLPWRAEGSAGYDLTSVTDCVIPAHGSCVVPTGVAVAIAPTWYGRVAPRSSLAVQHGLSVGAGVIDANYRGELKVVLFNHTDLDCKLGAGSRVAQLLLEKVASPEPVEVKELDTTSRGSEGFGSTGRKHAGKVSLLRGRGDSVADRVAKVNNNPKKILKTPPSKKTVNESMQEEPDLPLPKQGPEIMSPEAAREAGERTWNSSSFHNSQGFTKGHKEWMDRLSKGDLEGILPDMDQYLLLNDEALEENPRGTQAYKDECVKEAGLGEHFDEARYPHLTEQADRELLEWAVRRVSGCIWLEDTPRTYVRGFKHRLITRGPPVRMGLHRLSRTDTEWIERAIQEDVKRGQLRKGASQWGFPAFPTKGSAPHKAIKRKRRMVVDYRALNRVTVKKVFIIPNSDQIKGHVAGSLWLSVGDAKEGFNQCENEEGSGEKMAVVSVTGIWIPRGLTFGPTNGPEDFQELVFIVFSKRLYREWYLFIDDICIATGRKAPRPPGPTNKHDVWGTLKECSIQSQECLNALRAYKATHRIPKHRSSFDRIVRFLHLFSGATREGDLAEELFKAGLDRNVLVIVECWDILHSMDQDLTILETVLNLVAMIESGWFDGGHGSPPCNTFSAALFKPPGPFPVRSRKFLWGRPDIGSGRDSLRLEVGNWLLRVALACMSALAYAAASSSLEHPKDPGVDPFPSIWIMEEVKVAEEAEHAQRKLPFIRRDLDQCMYTAPAKKSTTITLNCVNSAKLERKCIHKGKHSALVEGKDPEDNSRFNTAKLKEFPKPLCRKLAKVHLDTIMLDPQLSSAYGRQSPFPACLAKPRTFSLLLLLLRKVLRTRQA